jgi:hypothetical protein
MLLVSRFARLLIVSSISPAEDENPLSLERAATNLQQTDVLIVEWCPGSKMTNMKTHTDCALPYKTSDKCQEKPGEHGFEQIAFSAPITSQKDNALLQRARQQYPLAAFMSDMGDLNPCSIFTGDFSEVPNKRSALNQLMLSTGIKIVGGALDAEVQVAAGVGNHIAKMTCGILQAGLDAPRATNKLTERIAHAPQDAVWIAQHPRESNDIAKLAIRKVHDVMQGAVTYAKEHPLEAAVIGTATIGAGVIDFSTAGAATPEIIAGGGAVLTAAATGVTLKSIFDDGEAAIAEGGLGTLLNPYASEKEKSKARGQVREHIGGVVFDSMLLSGALAPRGLKGAKCSLTEAEDSSKVAKAAEVAKTAEGAKAAAVNAATPATVATAAEGAKTAEGAKVLEAVPEHPTIAHEANILVESLKDGTTISKSADHMHVEIRSGRRVTEVEYSQDLNSPTLELQVSKVTFPGGKVLKRVDATHFRSTITGITSELRITVDGEGNILSDDGLEKFKFAPNGMVETRTSEDMFFIKGKRPSENFIDKMDRDFVGLPQEVRKLLKKEGIKVVVGDTIPDVAPELKDVRPRGHAEGSKWDHIEGFFRSSPEDKMVVVTEHRLDRISEKMVASDRLEGVLRHEVGHGVDEALHRCSQDDAFQAAYEADKAIIDRNLNDRQKDTLEYFLQSGYAGPSEAFAELFAILHGGGASRWCEPLMRTSFPNTLNLIEDRIEKLREPWPNL